MTQLNQISSNAKSVTVHVPFGIRLHGGRKLIVAPDGTWLQAEQPRYDNALIKALGRAFRWRKQLESGVYATTRELATAEKINESYVCRLLRLTLLAPDIVQAIVSGKQPAVLHLYQLLKLLPADWGRQREILK